MSKSLLEQARELKTKAKGSLIITEEHLELVVAWLNGEISSTQVTKTLNENGIGSNAANFASIALRDAICRGDLTIGK